MFRSLQLLGDNLRLAVVILFNVVFVREFIVYWKKTFRNSSQREIQVLMSRISGIVFEVSTFILWPPLMRI